MILLVIEGSKTPAKSAGDHLEVITGPRIDLSMMPIKFLSVDSLKSTTIQFRGHLEAPSGISCSRTAHSIDKSRFP